MQELNVLGEEAIYFSLKETPQSSCKHASLFHKNGSPGRVEGHSRLTSAPALGSIISAEQPLKSPER